MFSAKEINYSNYSCDGFAVVDPIKRAVEAKLKPDKVETLRFNAGVFRLYGLQQNASTSEMASKLMQGNQGDALVDLLEVAIKRQLSGKIEGDAREIAQDFVDELLQEDVTFLLCFAMDAMLGNQCGAAHQMVVRALSMGNETATVEQTKQEENSQQSSSGPALFKE